MEKTSASPKNEIDPKTLIEQFQTGIWRYLRSLGCESSLADDLVQDTFVSVLQKPFEHFSDAATASYLRKVASNLFISFKRREGKVVATENIEAISDAWQNWVPDESGDELVSSLNDCLQELTERARWALKMRFRDKLTRIKIAEHLKITEHGAKNLMQRAKQQLRGCVENKKNVQ
ncbi:MAG: RNA polymerase sigma factor [Planctomycetota bacterium]|jgi:RNA polymerase sigma-70 factor (ECF subfamily)|nr:RNA polymerase sigma factor [Planctomycetota bacterium]